MGSLFHVATETGIKCMAKYDYIPKRKKKGNNNGHMELYQAVRNRYETLEEEKK